MIRDNHCLSSRELAESLLGQSRAGVFAIRLVGGGVFVTWKGAVDIRVGAQLMQQARSGLCRRIHDQVRGPTKVEEGLRLAPVPENVSGLHVPTPIEELKRRHAPWIMVTAGEETRLVWSGDLMTCLGLVSYAEQTVFKPTI